MVGDSVSYKQLSLSDVALKLKFNAVLSIHPQILLPPGTPAQSSSGLSSQLINADYNLVLYTHGLFETPSLSTMNDTIEIAQSGFQTIILWTLHVDQDANLIYNNDYIVSDGQLNASYYGSNGLIGDTTSHTS